MEKRILILYEHNHLHYPILFFIPYHFSFISLFNYILSGLEISKKLILLCMDYDVTIRLENGEIQK